MVKSVLGLPWEHSALPSRFRGYDFTIRRILVKSTNPNKKNKQKIDVDLTLHFLDDFSNPVFQTGRSEIYEGNDGCCIRD